MPQAKIPSAPYPSVAIFESKIRATKEELDFYHKLLSWLLFSCHEEKRCVIEAFRKELSDLRNGGFSALLEGLDKLKNEAPAGAGRPDLFSDLAHLHLYFNHIDSAFQSLKSKIQQRFSDFARVCIW